MSADPRSVAQRVLGDLPSALSERDIVRHLVERFADELLRYGVGTVPGQKHDPDGTHAVEQICEDIETAQLVAEYLAAADDEAEEISPEERMQRVLSKAEQVKKDLEGGMSLQEAIRRELADTDCGACDHPTCDLYSIALANGTDKDNTKCEPGGPKVTAQVELVMTVGKQAPVDAEKILSIEALAGDDGKREGGLRVLCIGTGRGFTGAALAQIYPDAHFTLIEPELRRVWLLKRMINLLGVRNCTVRAGRPEDHLERLADRFDLVFVSTLPPRQAFLLGLPFARPAGRVFNLQDEHWSDRAAEYQRHGTGRRLPLHRPLEFESAAIRGHVLLNVMRPAEPEVSEATESGTGDDAIAV